MKRPLSLLEVMIGLALTAILLTTLFSGFRQLMQTKAQMGAMRQQKQWEYLTTIRLSQIFENIHDGAVFSTGPYRDIAAHALHFTFNNGIDLDPNFCQELEGYLLCNRENELCLIIESKEGKERKELLLKNGSDFKLEFFDLKKKTWLREWEKNELPPIVKLSISGKTFQFVLPHANRMVVYK